MILASGGLLEAQNHVVRLGRTQQLLIRIKPHEAVAFARLVPYGPKLLTVPSPATTPPTPSSFLCASVRFRILMSDLIGISWQ